MYFIASRRSFILRQLFFCQDHFLFDLSAFHLYKETRCSGENSNGTVIPTENFQKRRNTFKKVFLFSRFYINRRNTTVIFCPLALLPCSLMKYAAVLAGNEMEREFFRLYTLAPYQNCTVPSDLRKENVDLFFTQMESAPCLPHPLFSFDHVFFEPVLLKLGILLTVPIHFFYCSF